MKRGSDRERARDADALALPAAELVRVARRRLRRQADQLEQLGNPPSPLLGARADAVDHQPLADDARDPHARIQRAVRILEDDLHRAAHGAQLARGAARRSDRPSKRTSPAVGSSESQDQAAERRLAAARLADQPERLAGTDVERHVRRPRARRARGRPKSAAADGKVLP